MENRSNLEVAFKLSESILQLRKQLENEDDVNKKLYIQTQILALSRQLYELGLLY